MTRAALRRRAIDGPFAAMYSGKAERNLFAVWWLGGPVMAPTDPC